MDVLDEYAHRENDRAIVEAEHALAERGDTTARTTFRHAAHRHRPRDLGGRTRLPHARRGQPLGPRRVGPADGPVP
jgi:hypothetical protein